MKKMYCDYNPNDRKYYCSTDTQYGIIHPERCQMILNHDDLFDYIKVNQNKYCYVLPFMIADEFKKRLEEK